MRKNKAVLVFCPSKYLCEDFAKNMAIWAPKEPASGEFTSIDVAIRQYLASILYSKDKN